MEETPGKWRGHGGRGACAAVCSSVQGQTGRASPEPQIEKKSDLQQATRARVPAQTVRNRLHVGGAAPSTAGRAGFAVEMAAFLLTDEVHAADAVTDVLTSGRCCGEPENARPYLAGVPG